MITLILLAVLFVAWVVGTTWYAFHGKENQMEDWEEPYFTEEATAYGKKAVIWFVCITAPWVVIWLLVQQFVG